MSTWTRMARAVQANDLFDYNGAVTPRTDGSAISHTGVPTDAGAIADTYAGIHGRSGYFHANKRCGHFRHVSMDFNCWY